MKSRLNSAAPGSWSTICFSSGQGSVIELTKLAGEPLEILINQKLIARGEAVVVNEKFGVRITDIVSPMERVKQLG